MIKQLEELVIFRNFGMGLKLIKIKGVNFFIYIGLVVENKIYFSNFRQEGVYF